MRLILILLVLTLPLHAEDGFEAYKADYVSRQLVQIVKLPEDQQMIRYALLESNARRNYMQLTDERKFYWCWMGRYGLNATTQDNEDLQRYISQHFNMGRLSKKAYSFENYVKNREGN
jgi:hypothetical protein